MAEKFSRKLQIQPETNNSFVLWVNGEEFKFLTEENGSLHIYFPRNFEPEIKEQSVKIRRKGNK